MSDLLLSSAAVMNYLPTSETAQRVDLNGKPHEARFPPANDDGICLPRPSGSDLNGKA